MKKEVLLIVSLISLGISGCSSGTGKDEEVNNDTSIDITDAVFTEQSVDCATYAEAYISFVSDIKNNNDFEGSVEVITSDTQCTITVNGIPNHDFNDATAQFATNVSEVGRVFTINRNTSLEVQSTSLSQQYWDAIMLNGVVVDLLSAGCYKPADQSADQDGNVQIGCRLEDGWLLDPLGTESKFGADAHNAHTQPDGTYHYHGNPLAMFDDNPGEEGSPVIGFAADGFPIFGSYFLDVETNLVRKAVSGFELKSGDRPGPDDDNPGGEYDGLYRDDYEFTGNGDLDVCNGMTVNGQYGYYVTDSFPWMIGCYSGTLNNSFSKGPNKAKFEHVHSH